MLQHRLPTWKFQNSVARPSFCGLLENNGDIELEMGDYDAALDGFTPAALQNVNLHQAGDQGWDSVGGLKQVRDTLLQTLMWPSKVLH